MRYRSRRLRDPRNGPINPQRQRQQSARSMFRGSQPFYPERGALWIENGVCNHS